MRSYIGTGVLALEDNCDVITVANYGATDIAAGTCLCIDATNLDTTQGLPAVIASTTAARALVIGIAKTAILKARTEAGVTVPGIGQCASAGIVRALASSAAFSAGALVEAADGGLVAAGTTATMIIGKILKAETTTTPLIQIFHS
jgi:hypothetical protein